MGIRSGVRRSTLADANERRDWRIFADVAQGLIAQARRLYADEPLAVELDQTVYALDSTTIDLCLSLFPWARFQARQGAVKLHTLLDLRGSIPAFIRVSTGKMHDVRFLDELLAEAGAFYVMDRGYLDFARLHQLEHEGAFFITRAKKNTRFRVVSSRAVDKSTGLRCDQTILLAGVFSHDDYPEPLRRVRFTYSISEQTYVFLTNNFPLSALLIAQLYRERWKVELFFKWIKQHLRIKAFFGTSENAVKTQIWIAVAAYVLVAIVRKTLSLRTDLHRILQILSVSLFEKVHIRQLLTDTDQTTAQTGNPNQLLLFAL
jgi:transposase